MIEFKVTGETPEAFAKNATKAYAVLAFGLQRVLPELQAATASPASTAPVSAELADATPASASVATTVDHFPASDRVGAETPAKGTIKPEQISNRLSQVITAGADRGWSVERSRNYARKLLASVGGAKNVKEIDTDEKRALFMFSSEAFLAGTAAE